MFNKNNLKSKLNSIDGRGYKAYKSIEGAYQFEKYQLFIDHVQSDPFAPPSRIRVRVSQNTANFPMELFKNYNRKIALQDYLTRQFAGSISMVAKGKMGSGKSGLIIIDSCGQEILERTSMVVNGKYVEARFSVGLPARGRKIMAREAEEIFFNKVDRIINKALLYDNLNKEQLLQFIELHEDQVYLKSILKEQKLVAFVGNGAILPRESGVSDKPLKGSKVIPFKSPKGLEVTFQLPNNGQITGMGVPKGITLIVGGGYHGKSTLLRAIERGVYSHIPGDGREFVLTDPDAVKIRAEDGRSVQGVNISGFINNLPFQQDTKKFSSQNASGSTSQATNIVEAIEVGTKLLLLDEDTSATNFMIRDGRMQQLVSKDQEPITPLIDRVQELYEDFGVSSILVVGGSGDYFNVANYVIKMENYAVKDVTNEAKKIASRNGETRQKEVTNKFNVTERKVSPKSLKLEHKDKVKVRSIHKIQYGRNDIDLDFLEQLVDNSQTNAIAEIIRYAGKVYFDQELTLTEVVEKVFTDINDSGLDVISPFNGQHPGDLALPRKHEVCGAINRLRGIKIL